MSDMILQVEEKPVADQVRDFLNTLTKQQQREFLLMVHGAKIAMGLTEHDGEQQDKPA